MIQNAMPLGGERWIVENCYKDQCHRKYNCLFKAFKPIVGDIFKKSFHVLLRTFHRIINLGIWPLNYWLKSWDTCCPMQTMSDCSANAYIWSTLYHITVGHRRRVTAVTRLPRWRRRKTRLQTRPLLTMLQGMDRCDFWHANGYWTGLTLQTGIGRG